MICRNIFSISSGHPQLIGKPCLIVVHVSVSCVIVSKATTSVLTRICQFLSATPAQVSLATSSALLIIQAEIPSYRRHEHPWRDGWMASEVCPNVDCNFGRICMYSTITITPKPPKGRKLPWILALPCTQSLKPCLLRFSQRTAASAAAVYIDETVL